MLAWHHRTSDGCVLLAYSGRGASAAHGLSIRRKHGPDGSVCAVGQGDHERGGNDCYESLQACAWRGHDASHGGRMVRVRMGSGSGCVASRLWYVMGTGARLCAFNANCAGVGVIAL